MCSANASSNVSDVAARIIGSNHWALQYLKKALAAKDRNLHPVAILNSAARTTRWTGAASEKNAQFRRAKFEKQSWYMIFFLFLYFLSQSRSVGQ